MNKGKKRFKFKYVLIALAIFLVFQTLFVLLGNNNSGNINPAWSYNSNESEYLDVERLNVFYPNDWEYCDSIYDDPYDGVILASNEDMVGKYASYTISNYASNITIDKAIKKYLKTEENLSIESINVPGCDAAVRCKFENDETKHYIYGIKCEKYGYIFDFAGNDKDYYLENEFDKMFNDIDFEIFSSKTIKEKKEAEKQLEKARKKGKELGKKINKWLDEHLEDAPKPKSIQ